MTITFYDMMERSAPLSLQRKGLILLLVLITFGFSISFRERDLGDTSLDVQNGIKLALWVLSLGVAAVNANQLQVSDMLEEISELMSAQLSSGAQTPMQLN